MRYLRRLSLLALVITIGCFAYFKLYIEGGIDSVAPVINIAEEEIVVSVSATDEDLLQGMTATDDKDGDVTSTLVVESMGKFTENGKMKVTYAAFDRAGNVGTASRVVRYSDYISPHFAISEPMRLKKDDYFINIMGNVTAEDCIDGNLTGFIKYKTGENSYYGSTGDTLLSLQVTNSKGDTSVIEIYAEILDEKDFSKPYPVLSDYLVYVKVGEKINPVKYLTGISRNSYLYDFYDEDNDRYTMDMVRVNDSKVDYSKPGVYRIVYTLYSDEKNEGEDSQQGHVYQYIVVEE